jgi:hypothetical protein
VAGSVRYRFVACVSVVSLAGLVAVGADPHANVRVVFDEARVLKPTMRANAIGEAARIWRRYDVSFAAADDGPCDPENRQAVTVTIDIGHDPQSSDAGLGAIRFTAEGTPEPVIVLNFDAVTRIATSAPVLGVHPALWPAGLRDEIIARALGRALAHEIGHFLLRSPHHASSGLMQARQKGSVLGSPDERPFVLTSVDQARLRVALAAGEVSAVCPIVASR